MATIDRLTTGFPHGTPTGYEQGCRGNAACPNRGTTRMTCLEASARYARDLHYRRAYQRGDIILDRDTPVDAEKEKVRAATIRRALGGDVPTHLTAPAPATAPEPVVAPAPVLEQASEEPATGPEPAEDVHGGQSVRRWRHGTVSGYDRHHCRCDLCSAAKQKKNAGARKRRRDRIADGDLLPTAQEEIARLERALAKAELLAATATALTEQLEDERAGRAAAEDEVLRLTAEVSGVRADAASARMSLAELVALTRRPDSTAEVLRPPSITFDFVNGDLTVSMRGLMIDPDVEKLRSYLGTGS